MRHRPTRSSAFSSSRKALPGTPALIPAPAPSHYLPPATHLRRPTASPLPVHDLLIIGGGITGAGVAREAALRGLRVLLVEREDLASGTSSRSSRLVHGGVRYLEHGHLRLVFEASRERRILLTTAPHLVRPLAFTWPTYRDARLPRWKIGVGLALYDALALFRNVSRHERLVPDEVRAREPALTTSGLTGGLAYWDAATDDARLTLATARAAVEAGAELRTYTEVTALLHEGERVIGARLRDRLCDREDEVRARLVISATGPWTDRLLRLDGAHQPAAVRGTKGAHLLLPREAVGNVGALTLLAPQDGRVVFVLPAGDHALVGTTDTPTDASPDDVRASEADVAYLLGVVRHYFPDAMPGRERVVSAWAGIRPLAAAGYGSGPASASREHTIERRASGLLVVTGGKLTTYRSMAVEIVNAAAEALGVRLPPSGTARLPLPGGEGDVHAAREAATQRTGDAAVARRLTSAHGTRWEEVWRLAEAEPELRQRIVPSRPYLLAEAAHAACAEWARTLADVLVRRVPVAFETPDHGRAAARAVAPVVARVLGWDDRRLEAELARYEADVARLFTVDPA